MPEIDSTQLISTQILHEFFKRIQTRRRLIGRDRFKVGLRDSTLKTYSNKLNAFFVWLVQKRLIPENPLDYVKLRTPEYVDQRALPNEEIQKLYASVVLNSRGNSLLQSRDTVMISILFFCGLRKGEFISLRVTDIDFKERVLTVRAETSKSKRTRYVPIHPTLYYHLESYFKERNRLGYKTQLLIVSNNQDKGLSVFGLKHWTENHIKKSGIKFHLHRFRHSFACNLAKNGVHIVKIQKLMGHADIKMTQTYLRSISMEDTRDDIGKLSFG
ncbi:MAG: site-specific integrase [Candidatus Paceibacterota bacterium]